MPELLILGGTGEAAALARAAVARFGDTLAIVTSLAGRTHDPAPLAGQVRRGGFGGVDRLIEYLRARDVRLVVDALHPFAATMARHAAEACATAGMPRLALRRAPWTAQPGDRWTVVPDAPAAARAIIESRVRRAFLTTGAKDIAAFADLPEIWFLVRLIEPPAAPLPLAHHALLFARGPFDAAAEATLLREHGIDAVISKNSGGTATYGKIAAARALRLPVTMIAPPRLPTGEVASDVEAALAWIARHL